MMKKVLFTLAIAGMFGFVACNNTNKTEESADTNAVEMIAEEAEPAMDEAAEAVEGVAEEAVEGAVEEVAAE